MNKEVLNQMETLMEAIQMVEQDIRDYGWMVEKIASLKEQESIRDKNAGKLIVAGTAAYGLSASLPKAKNVNSDPTHREARKGLRHWERCLRYKRKIEMLEKAVSELKDERERIVIEGLLDGEKNYMIAQELNVTRQTVHEIKKSAIRNLAISMYLKDL